MSGVSDGDPRTEYRRRNAQPHANEQNTGTRGTSHRPPPPFTGGLFNFNETGRDPRTEYRRRERLPGTGVSVAQEVSHRNLAPRVESNNEDPRTRYRNVTNIQPIPSISQDRVNGVDPPVDTSKDGGNILPKVLGNVIADNKDHILGLVQGTRFAVAAPLPAPPVPHNINHTRVPTSSNTIRAAIETGGVSPAVWTQPTIATEGTNAPIMPTAPTTPTTPHIPTALYDGLICDPDWLAAIAHIDDVDHPPNLPSTLSPLSVPVPAEDKETTQLSNQFGDNVCIDDCDDVDYEWLEATSFIPDVDIPPECALEADASDIPSDIPVQLQLPVAVMGALVHDNVVVDDEPAPVQVSTYEV